MRSRLVIELPLVAPTAGRGDRLANPDRRSGLQAAFTLAEVLAALVLMAIVVPVAMQGLSTASRAGILGQRKAEAARVAQRVLAELIVTGEVSDTSTGGTIAQDNTTYAWTLESTPWTEDDMDVITVRVEFIVQGDTYDVSLSTLYDPGAEPVTATL